MSIGHICGASRGRYSDPVPINDMAIKWKSETDRIVKPPCKIRCESGDFLHPRKRWFPYEKMYVQKWVVTKKELREAIRCYDMFSLEMPLKIICPWCYEKLKKGDRK